MDRTGAENGTFWQHLLQPMRRWLAERRDLPEAEEDADIPESNEIVFHTLDPIAMPSAALHTFEEMTEPWIERQCNALCFEQAHWYPDHRQVRLLETTPVRISALTQGRSLYGQEISLENGELIAICTCRKGQSNTANLLGAKHCRHVIAVLLASLELQGTQSAKPVLECLCPVTRQPITNGRTVYQCRQCKTSYSPEGWEFLRKTDRGRCCSCHQRKTIAQL